MTIQMKGTLEEILEDYADLGFRLEEEGDHIVTLYFKEDRIANFNQARVTKEVIWQVCQGYMDRLNGKGVPFEE